MGYFINWDQSIDLMADDSNWDPTELKSIWARFEDRNYASNVFPTLTKELTRNGANLTATLSPL